MKLIRILVYEGDRKWIDRTMEKSIIGKVECGNGCSIEEKLRLEVTEDSKDEDRSRRDHVS